MSLTGLSSSQPNLGGSTSDSSYTAFIWSDVFDKLVKWLKEVQKGCSDKYLFLFYCVASRATGFPVEPTWLYIFLVLLCQIHSEREHQVWVYEIQVTVRNMTDL